MSLLCSIMALAANSYLFKNPVCYVTTVYLIFNQIKFIKSRRTKLVTNTAITLSSCLFVCPVLSVFLPARRYASAGYSDRNVSVRLSVRHAPVLCQNEES